MKEFDKETNEIFKHISKKSINRSKKIIEKLPNIRQNFSEFDKVKDHVDILIWTSKIDLKSSRTLYDQELYPQSVFYLEQSVEKITKAYSIAVLGLDPKDAKKRISHKSPKTMLKKVDVFKEIHDEFKKNYHELNEIISDKNKEKICKMNRDNIETLLVALEETEKQLEIDIVFDQIRESKLIDGLIEIIFSIDICESEVEKIKNKTFKILEKKTSLEEMGKMIPTLLYLSLLTFSHAEFSRYPPLPEDKASLSPIDYDEEEVDLIIFIDKICNIIEECINDFEDFLKEYEELKEDEDLKEIIKEQIGSNYG
ncbi:MAG: HEPN domain-containing protein [Promethearchaeia archaeon]